MGNRRQSARARMDFGDREEGLVRGTHLSASYSRGPHMRRTSQYDSRRRPPQVKSSRLRLEPWEARLPLGDILLGPGLAGSWLARSAMSRAESWMGVNSQAEIRVSGERPAQFSNSVLTQTNRAASALFFVNA